MSFETRKQDADNALNKWRRATQRLPFRDHDLWCCPAHAEEAGAR